MKNALVLVDDFGHPKSTILPVIDQMFDLNEWNICVLDRIDQIVDIISAPDMIVSFKNSISEFPRDKGNWYYEAFTYKWPDFVTKNGCGFLMVHAGFAFIPAEHPIISDVIRGSFGGHAPLKMLEIIPVENIDHPILNGVEKFTSLSDEQFEVVGLSKEKTNILAYSYSDEGVQPCVWAHEAGGGRVAVILPGHANPGFQTLRHPSMIRMLQNAVKWVGKVD